MRLVYEKIMNRQAFKNPTQKINEKYMIIDMHDKTLQNSIKLKFKEAKNSYIKELSRLDSRSKIPALPAH